MTESTIKSLMKETTPITKDVFRESAKLAPQELMKSGQEYGIFGNQKEIEAIKAMVEMRENSSNDMPKYNPSMYEKNSLETETVKGKESGKITIEEIPKQHNTSEVELKDALNDGIHKKHLPRTGTWEGKEGKSIWHPNPNEIPKKANKENLTFGEILKKYDIGGIEFKDGEPDFKPAAEIIIKINDFGDRLKNFTQADGKAAEVWTKEQKDGKSWTPQEVAQYRKENGLSWHEKSDQKTLVLVPSVIHANVPHSGGQAARIK